MVFKSAQIAGMVYAILSLVIVTTLYRKKKFNRKTAYGFTVVSIIMGFLVFAPMLPWQMQSLLLGTSKQIPTPVATLVLVIFVLLTFIFSRAFCGYTCPIGSVQELLYHLPLKKFKINNRIVPLVIRFIVLPTFIVVAAVYSIGILKEIGLKDFFFLTITAWTSLIFIALVVISALVYRPFCRFGCPYGMLLSLAAIKSRFKIRQNESCIDCKNPKCVSVCPTGEALSTSNKMECYLCYRCIEACPTQGIEYGRDKKP
ncbi:MAG: 4Fe-4S binding protein [Chloroflexi bacterium]|nr:4Fe-4S binding protein [Chloroflexota bacterium]MBT7081687.1 4Fe-4S binding protein [Chloroflexota bacterium]MBT7290074.1 4Fe-4S binding protein [Chloroflexota bacterium]